MNKAYIEEKWTRTQESLKEYVTELCEPLFENAAVDKVRFAAGNTYNDETYYEQDDHVSINGERSFDDPRSWYEREDSELPEELWQLAEDIWSQLPTEQMWDAILIERWHDPLFKVTLEYRDY